MSNQTPSIAELRVKTGKKEKKKKIHTFGMQIVCQTILTTGPSLRAALTFYFKTAPICVPNYRVWSWESHQCGLEKRWVCPMLPMQVHHK